jgi:hypothetical protein
MDCVSEHVAAHPYYLQGIADERARVVTIIEMAMCHCRIDCDGGTIGQQKVIELLDDINGESPYELQTS